MVLQRRKKAACKSRPSHLVSSAWCLWIVHECGFCLQAKNGFQYLCQYGRFSKIQSQMIVVLMLNREKFTLRITEIDQEGFDYFSTEVGFLII